MSWQYQCQACPRQVRGCLGHLQGREKKKKEMQLGKQRPGSTRGRGTSPGAGQSLVPALHGEDGVTADLRCPICASGTRSRIMRQASYTMVEGSNCIVFTTLPMLIFSERATMVAAGLSPLLRHLPEDTTGSALGARTPRAPRGPDGGRDLLGWRQDHRII